MIIHGKVTERTGSTFVIFGYNGRDGVVTDRNGLLYMRARYYSPEHRRFVNADVIPGEISNAITLNRYAYANGNPVSNVDPFGLSAERGSSNWYGAAAYNKTSVTTINEEIDLTFGLNLVRLSHTQTVTTTNKQYGTTGDWFGAYAYTSVNVAGFDAKAGVGLKILYILGFDVNVRWLGAGATLSINIDDFSLNANLDINLFGDTSASVGIVKKLENGDQVSNQYGIKGDTIAVIAAVATLVTGAQMNVTPERAPLVPAPA